MQLDQLSGEKRKQETDTQQEMTALQTKVEELSREKPKLETDAEKQSNDTRNYMRNSQAQVRQLTREKSQTGRKIH